MPKFVTKIRWHRAVHHDPKNQWLRKALLAEIRRVVGIEH
jgi:hypothetical protein